MCFVTYLPSQQGFILTSNRDEQVGRPKALPPKKFIINKQSVFYPQDGLAGGTWIAASPQVTLCLLNGAFVKHLPQPPYRQSRGLVLLDFFEYQNQAHFIEEYNFRGIEPFTLIIVEERQIRQLTELRWDGTKLYQKPLNTENSYAWSSVTLYSDEVIGQREQWFDEWQQRNPFFEGKDIFDFHHLGGKGDAENDLFVNRNNELRTVSMTQVQKTSEQFLINYWDKLNEQQYRYRIFDSEKVVYS